MFLQLFAQQGFVLNSIFKELVRKINRRWWGTHCSLIHISSVSTMFCFDERAVLYPPLLLHHCKVSEGNARLSSAGTLRSHRAAREATV